MGMHKKKLGLGSIFLEILFCVYGRIRASEKYLPVPDISFLMDAFNAYEVKIFLSIRKR